MANYCRAVTKSLRGTGIFYYFKDIVQQKRGGSGGVPLDSPRLCTQSVMFLKVHLIKEPLSCFKYQKPVAAFMT
jgi:hypothetical protein